jgi:hypothetical protein
MRGPRSLGLAKVVRSVPLQTPLRPLVRGGPSRASVAVLKSFYG